MPTTHHKIVGNVSYSISGSKLYLQDGWEHANIDTAFIPQLKGVPTYGGKFSGNVRFYRLAIPQLKAAFEEVERAGLVDKILFWDGSFVPRPIRGSSTSPSNHSFGTAFDINADWNAFHRTPAAVGAKGDLHAIAAIFKRFGFTWGGDWKPGNADGMHFEVNRILSAQEINAAKGVSKPAQNAVEPTVVLSVWDGEKWHDKRVESILKGNTNYLAVQELLREARVPFTVSEWGDGTPNIRIVPVDPVDNAKREIRIVPGAKP